MESLRKQHDLAARPYRVYRQPNQGVPCDRQNRSVRSPTLSHVFHIRRNIGTLCINWMIQPERRRHLVPLLIEIGCKNRRAGALRQRSQQNSNWTLPNHQHRLVRL